MSASENMTGPAIVSAVLGLHVADEYGFCAGCLDAWARLAPVPCPEARAAMSALQPEPGWTPRERCVVSPTAVNAASPPYVNVR